MLSPGQRVTNFVKDLSELPYDKKWKIVKDVISLGVGIPSWIWFWYATNWQAAIALFLVLFANNASQDNS